MALSVQTEQITIQADKTEMEGTLSLPEDSIGMILCATCGSDSGSRVSQPNDYVASVLREARLGTLRIELLSRTETNDRQLHSDVALLTERLHHACDWLRTRDAIADLPIGLYGTSSCATAMLQMASASGRGIAAIVSRRLPGTGKPGAGQSGRADVTDRRRPG